MNPNSLVYQKCAGVDDFLKKWMRMLTPFHKLSLREQEVAARIISQYFRLKESVPDPEVLKEVLWTKTSRKDMMDSLHMSRENFQMTLKGIKDAGVLVDGMIHPKFIPDIPDNPRFQLLIVFDWSSESNPIKVQEQ